MDGAGHREVGNGRAVGTQGSGHWAYRAVPATVPDNPEL